jgi:uncharacterized protein YecT (DUF1311 family)
MNIFLILLGATLIGTCDSIGQTQAEMNETANNNFNKADKELNTLYVKLTQMLSDEEKQLLKIAQRDWLKFRDSHCKFEIVESDGGSIQPLLYSMCLTETTEERIEDLKEAIKSRTH